MGQVLLVFNQFRQQFQWNICPHGNRTLSSPFSTSLRHMQQLGCSTFPFLSFLQYFSLILKRFNFFKAFSSQGGWAFLALSSWFCSRILIISSKKLPLKLDLKFEEKLSLNPESKLVPKNVEKIGSNKSSGTNCLWTTILKGIPPFENIMLLVWGITFIRAPPEMPKPPKMFENILLTRFPRMFTERSRRLGLLLVWLLFILWWLLL